MNSFEYDEIYVGMQEQFNVKITSEMMRMFCEITKDENPLHISEEYAQNKGFKGKVVYGMLTSSFISTLAGMYIPGEHCLIHSVEIKFLKPIYVNDELQIIGTVIEINDTVKQIVIKVAIINHKNEKVLRGCMKVGVIK